MTSFRPFAALVLVAVLSASALAATPKGPEAVGRAMQDRNYEAALKAIDEAVKDKDAAQDYLAYLKGRALHLAIETPYVAGRQVGVECNQGGLGVDCILPLRQELIPPLMVGARSFAASNVGGECGCGVEVCRL